MIRLETITHVPGLTGREVTDFLAFCGDERYRAWWPGTHLELHTVRGAAGAVGSHVHMDEYVGARRLKMTGEVLALDPGRRLVWQARHGLPLPLRLILTLTDTDGGVRISHVIEAGYRGIGAVLDPLLRLWFSGRFAADMEAHVREEFPRLRDLLRREADRPAATN